MYIVIVGGSVTLYVKDEVGVVSLLIHEVEQIIKLKSKITYGCLFKNCDINRLSD